MLANALPIFVASGPLLEETEGPLLRGHVVCRQESCRARCLVFGGEAEGMDMYSLLRGICSTASYSTPTAAFCSRTFTAHCKVPYPSSHITRTDNNAHFHTNSQSSAIMSTIPNTESKSFNAISPSPDHPFPDLTRSWTPIRAPHPKGNPHLTCSPATKHQRPHPQCFETF